MSVDEDIRTLDEKAADSEQERIMELTMLLGEHALWHCNFLQDPSQMNLQMMMETAKRYGLAFNQKHRSRIVRL